MVETINKLIRVSRQLLQELGHEPTPEEIAEEMGMPVDKVREILKIAQEPVSLETPIGEEEDSHLGDFIPDDDAAVARPRPPRFTPAEGAADGRARHPDPARGEGAQACASVMEDGRTAHAGGGGQASSTSRASASARSRPRRCAKLRHPSRSSKLKDYLED